MKYLFFALFWLAACQDQSASSDGSNTSSGHTPGTGIGTSGKTEDSLTVTRNIATVKQFLRLLEEEKISDYINLYAEDGMQINPYASGLFPDTIRGKEALTKFWEPVPARFNGMQYPIERIMAMQDPDWVLIQFKGIINLKNNAGQYNNQYLGLFHLNATGKILEYQEYFNPVTVIKAFGLQHKL